MFSVLTCWPFIGGGNMRKASLLAVLLMAASVALAQGTYTQIDYPGSTFTYCWGVNRAGDISGGYTDTAGNYHGFLLSNGVYVSFDYPGAGGTEGWGLN